MLIWLSIPVIRFSIMASALPEISPSATSLGALDPRLSGLTVGKQKAHCHANSSKSANQEIRILPEILVR